MSIKRRIADAVLWIIGPLMDWCFENCTWIPLGSLGLEVTMGKKEDEILEEVEEILRDVRERLLEAGIVGVPYISNDYLDLRIRVTTVYRDSVSFLGSPTKCFKDEE